MPRKPSIIPNVEMTLSIPQDLYAKISLDLFSEVEGRVPYGAFKGFFEGLVRDHYASGTLDIATLISGLQPGVHLVRGRREDLELLKYEWRTVHAYE